MSPIEVSIKRGEKGAETYLLTFVADGPPEMVNDAEARFIAGGYTFVIDRAVFPEVDLVVNGTICVLTVKDSDLKLDETPVKRIDVAKPKPETKPAPEVVKPTSFQRGRGRSSTHATTEIR